MPETFSPTCVKVTSVVFAPCGELTVTSQSPATFGVGVCAKPGAAARSSSAASVSLQRIMGTAPERVDSCKCRERRILTYLPSVARAAGRQRAFAHISQLRRPGDQVAFQLALHRDFHHLAVFRHAPDDRHFAAGEPSFDGPLAVFVGDTAGQLGAGLVDGHVDAYLSLGGDELDAPHTGRALLRE